MSGTVTKGGKPRAVCDRGGRAWGWRSGPRRRPRSVAHPSASTEAPGGSAPARRAKVAATTAPPLARRCRLRRGGRAGGRAGRAAGPFARRGARSGPPHLGRARSQAWARGLRGLGAAVQLAGGLGHLPSGPLGVPGNGDVDAVGEKGVPSLEKVWGTTRSFLGSERAKGHPSWVPGGWGDGGPSVFGGGRGSRSRVHLQGGQNPSRGFAGDACCRLVGILAAAEQGFWCRLLPTGGHPRSSGEGLLVSPGSGVWVSPSPRGQKCELQGGSPVGRALVRAAEELMMCVEEKRTSRQETAE